MTGSPRARLVVVGNGMAGARAVEEILARRPDLFQVTMFGEEPYGNYNRIQLSNLLADGTDPDDEIYLNPAAWYAANGVTLHAGVRIVRIDRFARLVYGDDGSVTRYDKLIVATGSRTFFPPMEGMWADDRTLTPGVFGFRTMDDTMAMLRHARAHHRAVVIGGGLLGLEAARGLQRHGVEVDVVHSAPWLMNQQLDAQAGRILRASMQRLGITVHTGARSTAILHEGGPVTGVRFADGTELGCDMVVLTAGIRPNVGLATVSGLTVERAIVVDDQLRSVDDDDIYVVGECAQHRGEVYGLVAPLWEQATVLADHITGTDPHAAYHGSRMATRLKVAGVDVATMGVKEPEREDDEFVQFSEPGRGVYKTVVIRDGLLIGATLLGDVSKAGFLIQAFGGRSRLPEDRLRLLFEMGTPGPETAAAELADTSQVCNCNGVSKGQITACVRDGATSVSGVMNTTRAGKGCGACKELVADLVALAAGDGVEEDPDWYVPCIPLAKPALMAEVRARGLRSVSSVFAALAPDGEHAASKMPLASLLRMMWGRDYLDERDARFINDRVHANIQKDGTFSVVPQIKGGVTTPAELRRIAEVAEKYDVPMVKITGGQRIDLLGVRKEDLPGVWEDLGMPSGHAYGKSFRTVKTCVGSDFCRYGLGDSTALGIALEDRYKGLESPGKLKLAVAGCPRNCSEALVKDLGVVAVDGGRWEVYVGGAAGAHVRKGDLLATVGTPREVMTLAGRFLQYYRENARWLERTYAFVPRIGIERLRSVLQEEGARLDDAMQASVDAYTDPWQERATPVTEGQFRSSLPLVPLPRVPVR
ncbi:nitrite reductase large subunit NirB [Actinomadura scrupuli]|uniref:nitrite reductase large subunit NirB n=1 Tax=Actinomadura scrupuli TaxID=559629 RepID=UPI003D99DA6D